MVNNGLGHATGDTLLREVADRLKVCVREADTVARIGSDEFIIVLEGLACEDQAFLVAEKLLKAMENPFPTSKQEFFLGCSIGISLFPGDGDNAKSLISNADKALRLVKTQGRNGVQGYNAVKANCNNGPLVLDTDLRLALKRDELLLHYQPQIDLLSGKILGLEALLRWQHPRLGFVSPMEFIPLAEETGLITAIDEWVLRAACSQARMWQDAGLPSLRMAVNLSPYHFIRAGLPQQIGEILSETGLDGRYLALEITERLLIQDLERAVTIAHKLKTMGIQLAIDDFGTGYSSLNYLRCLPIDCLKIDRSFVNNITIDRDGAAIAAAIIAIAHNLKLEAIAEGVETEAQLALLKSQCCDALQGYYFSRPLPPREMANLLRSHHSKSSS
jgi:diguanylate cyclase (GGDEF)-like protein